MSRATSISGTMNAVIIRYLLLLLIFSVLLQPTLIIDPSESPIQSARALVMPDIKLRNQVGTVVMLVPLIVIAIRPGIPSI